MIDSIHSFKWNVIINPCFNLNGNLAKQALKLGMTELHPTGKYGGNYIHIQCWFI